MIKRNLRTSKDMIVVREITVSLYQLLWVMAGQLVSHDPTPTAHQAES